MKTRIEKLEKMFKENFKNFQLESRRLKNNGVINYKSKSSNKYKETLLRIFKLIRKIDSAVALKYSGFELLSTRQINI